MSAVFHPLPTTSTIQITSPTPLRRSIFCFSHPRVFVALFPSPFPSRSRFQFCHPLPTSSHFRPLGSTSHNATPFPDESSEESPNFLADARLAVSGFLQEFGISEEESVSITINSPQYVQMLIDGVRELDETSMWDSWKTVQGDEPLGYSDDYGFKEKVILIAKEKGDCGKAAFLESAGMSLSSAMNVSRYLSGEMLPSLIYKVKYMKEVFFSGCGCGDEYLIGKSARRMMKHLSIPVDDEVQQTLSFFEKIEARRGGLDTLSSDEESFRVLLESFPRMLLLSIESHVKPMVEFLQDIGICRERMSHIILLFPPIIFFNAEILRSRILAYKEVGIDDMKFGKLLLKYPWVLSRCMQDSLHKILSFFTLEKVPHVNIINAFRSWPLLLGSSTSKLKLIVDEFGELDVKGKKLGQVIATSPQILLQKPREFLQVVSFLEEIGFDKETIGKILTRCPEISSASVEKTLKRKLKFLNGIGVSKTNITRAIRKYPELLVSDPDRTLLPRIRYLRRRGLSARDVAFMVGRFSPLLGYSIEQVLKPKLDFLVNIMEKPVKEVVDYPRYFSYSLEKKIKPRFWVLRGRNVECSLKDMLGINDEDFASKFMGNEGPQHSVLFSPVEV